MLMLVKIVFAHVIGDYLLQTDYMATNKGKDFYILFVHCVCYLLPFIYFFGLDYRAFLLFITHYVIDMSKSRYNAISLFSDQLMHYFVAALLYFVMV